MKVTGLFSAVSLLCIGTVIAQESSAAEKYDTYQPKAVSSSPLQLDTESYGELVTSPRDYSIVVLLTAQDARFGCGVCKEFQPEWEVLGKSWAKGDRAGKSRVLYGTLDFQNGKEVFQKLMLQTAPVVFMFLPTEGPNAKPDDQPLRIDFSSGMQSAEQVHDWVCRHQPDNFCPALARPINYARIVAIVTTALASITIWTLLKSYIVPVIQNRNLWAGISLILVLLFTSGHMFNHIRKTPYVSGDGKGGISYFAPGIQSQFGLETQIVAAIYGLLSFATISLALKVPRIASARKQQIAVYVWGAVMLGVYSFLLSVFRGKNAGYPFWLPPF